MPDPADLANPEQPQSAIGIIVEAYRRRRDAGGAPFTALTCDNIQHNGDVLRDAVLTFARLRDATLADWIEAHADFPNTMVDRITPVTAPADIAHLDRPAALSTAGRWSARTSPSGLSRTASSPGGRPGSRSARRFVGDVAPYEMMKLRLLNGSHLAIAALRPAGRLHLHRRDHGDPLFRRYMAALMDRETGPTLKPVPGIDLADYKRTLIARFANPAIKDTVERVNTDAPLNVLVVPIGARLATNGSVDLLALALAGWMRRVLGIDEQGQPIDVRHPLAALLRQKADEGGADPARCCRSNRFSAISAPTARLVEPLRKYLASLYQVGSLATLEHAAEDLAF